MEILVTVTVAAAAVVVIMAIPNGTMQDHPLSI